ncbi:MAG: DNA photolyase [Leptospiraceae bacterium]|nr:DNA photolyase [Leptospiraceae bacterium]
MKFSHIYIEKEIIQLERTQRILNSLRESTIVEIDNYKNIFNRSNQNFQSQKQKPKLILAKKKDQFYYIGSPLTKSSEIQNFYYNNTIMNCVYNCEYCYLQGMYNSSHIVVFVNLEDFFSETEKLLEEKKSILLCISYDTDMLAIEKYSGFIKEWILFAKNFPNLQLEIRTKSNKFNEIEDLEPSPNVLLAWTLSPESVVKDLEHKTPTLNRRIDSMQKAIDRGWNVRICFDPILFVEDYKTKYSEMLKTVFSKIRSEKIFDFTVGVFRISKDYLKNIKKMRTDSKLIYFPYTLNENTFTYPENLESEMKDFFLTELKQYVTSEKVWV